MKVYDRAQEAFPGGPLPAVVAVSAPDVTAPAGDGGRSMRSSGPRSRPAGCGEPISVDVSASRRAARVLIPLAGTGTDEHVQPRARHAARRRVIPSTIGTRAAARRRTSPG